MGMEILHTIFLIFHVLGATIIVGVAFVTAVIEIKKFNSTQMAMLREILWTITGITLLVQIITGFYLAGSEWSKISVIPYFWIKMFLLFVIGGIVGFINHKRLKEFQEGKGQDESRTRWIVVSCLLFATIAALGVIIAENAS